MTPERWKQIEKIYHAALEREPKERAVFLDQACHGDTALREEVESLLTHEQPAESFIEVPALEAAAKGLVVQQEESLVGRQLGAYKILSLLGAGGMGEVYRARDSKLNRDVALKLLPGEFAQHAERMARFQREAHLLASLNHPNIAAIHGLEESSGVRALVMELVEGPTLADRIARGPIPLEESLAIARQMAEALEYAHEHGVIHRDLKPANVKVTAEGVVKVLDFGLAKALEGGTTTGDLENSPTLTVAATASGVILGTAAYMAPEQARGKAVDRRADIWSFGVVFYEMLTGKRLYGEETVSDTLAAVLTRDPDWEGLPAGTPASIRKLLRRCLERDRKKRLQSIGDARLEIEECLSAPSGRAEAEAIGLKPIVTGRRREHLAWALALAFLVAAIVSAVAYLRLVRAPAQPVISEIMPPEKTQFTFKYETGGPPVLSPDGGAVAFSATDANGKQVLWVRSLASLTAQPLAETEGGTCPFWSPDSRSLGFFADGKLKTLAVLGGPAVAVSEAPFHRGGSWNREGTLLFVPDASKGLYQVAASGGAPVPVFKLDPSKYVHYTWPKFLPDGKHFLYCAHAVDPASSGTYFASLDGKENRLLLKGEIRSTYALGYLLYILNRTLMAQAFDPERGQLKGDAHPVAARIHDELGHYSFNDVSENGVLIYQADLREEKRITWFDRAGKELGAGEKRSFDTVRLSPDGTKIAFDAGDPNKDIWVDELARGVHMRLTNDPGTDHGNPTWSPDGSRILFKCLDKSQPGIYQMNSNGAGGKELLLGKETSGPLLWPTDWSRDGKFILFARGTPPNPVQEVWVLPLAGDRKPRLFVQNGYNGQFSPDGRWVAYTSWESGEAQIYVVPFDATKVLNAAPGSVTIPGGKWQISTSGGTIARWRRDGKEIFYFGVNHQMMATEVDEKGNNFAARKEQVLFTVGAVVQGEYDVTPDGKRFVMTTQKVNPNTPLTLVQNWTALVRNKP